MKYYFEDAGELKLNEKGESVDISQSKPVRKFENADFALALLLLLCGFLYWNVVVTCSLGLGIFVFALILCAITLYYFRTKSIKQTKATVAWLGIIGIASLQFILFDGNFIKELNLIFLSVCFIYWVGISAGNVTGRRLSLYTIWDFFHQTFIVPFSNISCEYFGLKHGFSKNRYSKNVKYVFLGFVVFLPLMIFVINQLSAADAVFETLLHKIWQVISWDALLQYGVQFILGIPVACYLFGLIYGNATSQNKNYTKTQQLDKWVKEISFAPKLTVYTVLTAFNIIYMVFFISQMAYFLSGFQNILPDSFTYAGYARRGFFELCKISAVNVIIITLAHSFIVKKESVVTTKGNTNATKGETVTIKRATPKMLRIQTGLLSIMTIGLIVTALSKMYMYIESYGLTQLRVYSSLFMVMLLFAFTVILFRQIKAFNASRIIIVGSIIGFMLFSYGNIDGNIAKYNIEGYEAGRLEKIDYNMLIGLSDGAVPYLYELYKSMDNKESKLIVYYRIMYGDRGYIEMPYDEFGIKNFNLQSERTANIRALLQSEGFVE